MREVSKKVLHQTLGNLKINLFQLQGEEDFILLIQEKSSNDLAVVGREDNGHFILASETSSTQEKSFMISSVNNLEIEELSKKLANLIVKKEM